MHCTQLYACSFSILPLILRLYHEPCHAGASAQVLVQTLISELGTDNVACSYGNFQTMSVCPGLLFNGQEEHFDGTPIQLSLLLISIGKTFNAVPCIKNKPRWLALVLSSTETHILWGPNQYVSYSQNALS